MSPAKCDAVMVTKRDVFFFASWCTKHYFAPAENFFPLWYPDKCADLVLLCFATYVLAKFLTIHFSEIFQVLFPLLDRVRTLSSSASNKKVDAGGSILIHHTRNTAQKQWAETQVPPIKHESKIYFLFKPSTSKRYV